MSDDPRVGTKLAGYRIEWLPGWGGMSVVYRLERNPPLQARILGPLAASLAEDESFRELHTRGGTRMIT
jgi:hypothetical protein